MHNSLSSHTPSTSCVPPHLSPIVLAQISQQPQPSRTVFPGQSRFRGLGQASGSQGGQECRSGAAFTWRPAHSKTASCRMTRLDAFHIHILLAYSVFACNVQKILVKNCYSTTFARFLCISVCTETASRRKKLWRNSISAQWLQRSATHSNIYDVNIVKEFPEIIARACVQLFTGCALPVQCQCIIPCMITVQLDMQTLLYVPLSCTEYWETWLTVSYMQCWRHNSERVLSS